MAQTKKIVSIVGARPQFVKLAPLSRKIREHWDEVIVHSGQHYDDLMSKSFFDDLNIPPPDYNLNVGSGGHNEQVAIMLQKLDALLLAEKPDLVVIFGDTNTTLAAALAAVKMGIPVVHIEAGLRSFNRSMPEEINRIVADHSCDFLFAPTTTAMTNLEKENLLDRSFLSGDIMVDAIEDNIERALEQSEAMERLGLEPGSFHLMTLHRPYNVDDAATLGTIIKELGVLDERILFPVHPRTRKIIDQNRIKMPSNLILANPQGFLDFISLEHHCSKILTDSGGIQKEAYIHGKPCITIRPETEWVETVQDGWNILLPAGSPDFASSIDGFNPDRPRSNVFGSDVGTKMIELIEEII